MPVPGSPWSFQSTTKRSGDLLRRLFKVGDELHKSLATELAMAMEGPRATKSIGMGRSTAAEVCN